MRYSIIIPVHNSAKTLPTTMESVFQQQKLFDEIILVENASVDESLALCQKFSQDHNNIKVISSKQSGLSLARNLGIKQATGDYLFLLDSDDTLAENFLFIIDQNIVNLEKRGLKFDLYELNFNHYFSTTTFQKNPFILSKGEYLGGEYLLKTLKTFHEESKFMAWRYVYSKNFFADEKHYFDENIKLFEDIAYMQKNLTDDMKIYVLGSEPLVNYLHHENSMTHSKINEMINALIKVCQQIDDISPIQKQYFCELVVKMAPMTEYQKFYLETQSKSKIHAWVSYFVIKCGIILRRIKRKWLKVDASTD